MDEAELRKLALAATDGPWCYENVGEKSNDIVVGCACEIDENGNIDLDKPLSGNVQDKMYDEEGDEIGYRDIQICLVDDVCENLYADAAYIAAANPQAILELLDRLEAIGELCNELKNDWAPDPPPFDADNLIREIQALLENHNGK